MNCTNCHKELDTHTSVHGETKPKEGTLSICFYCGTLSVFNEDLTLRDITQEELDMLEKADPLSFRVVSEAQKAIKRKISLS